MNKKPIVFSLLLAACIIAISVFAGCSAGQGPGPAAAAPQAEEGTIAPELTARTESEDLETAWDEAAATMISLEGESITVNGEGAAAKDSVLTITKAGAYVVSGTLTNGQIKIAAANTDTVRLILKDAHIANQTGAAIYAAQCRKLIVTLAEATSNSLTDGGANYLYEDAANEEPNAALFSKDDLTVNGRGSLTVNAGFNNGIGTKDHLLIVSGNITVTAANHGLRGNDSLTLLAGDLRITAGKDGMQTNNTEEAGKGYILIEGGKVAIASAYDGIQAEQLLIIRGGEFDITAGGGSAKPAATATTTAATATTATTAADASATSSDSFKGIKTGGDMEISGGSFAIDSKDDSIHANGSIAISGGDFILRTGDDGIHADGDLTISGGKIGVEQSYEGLEANNINISAGSISIVSSDDGLNAAGGSDGNGEGGPFGRDSFFGGGVHSITVSGGELTIFAGGDGFDSNGSIAISGGKIISIIDSRANGAMDCDGAFTLTGGTLIYGGTETGNLPGADSTQSYVYVTGIAAGSEITVKKEGKTLISFTLPVNCQTLALSSPDIAKDQSYEVYSGETLLAEVTAGIGGSQMGGQMGDRGRGAMMRPEGSPPAGPQSGGPGAGNRQRNY
ncbi:MAG: carbohydrate-binding domain-containing protein [Clostridiales bacterium]